MKDFHRLNRLSARVHLCANASERHREVCLCVIKRERPRSVSVCASSQEERKQNIRGQNVLLSRGQNVLPRNNVLPSNRCREILGKTFCPIIGAERYLEHVYV